MEIAVPFIIKDLIVPVLHFAFYLPHKSRSPGAPGKDTDKCGNRRIFVKNYQEK